jgi:hypothetical protein
MKKSGKVGLVLIAALGLSSCGRRAPEQVQRAPESGTMAWDDKPRDPCSKEHFSDGLCQSAVNNRGYHYGGLWFPMMYAASYGQYYDSHRSYLAGGGKHAPVPSTVYAPGFVAPAKGTIVRGGFGSTLRSGSSVPSMAPPPVPHSGSTPAASSHTSTPTTSSHASTSSSSAGS